MLKIFCYCFTAFESYFVSIQIEYFQCIIFEKVLHQNVYTIISEKVFSNRKSL